MAITITPLNGTDSISSSRLTINDNFNICKNAINNIITVLSQSTYSFNNVSQGGTISTTGLTIAGSAGITLNLGNLSIANGGISAVGATFTGDVKLRGDVLFGATTIDLAGNGSITYVTLPKMTTAQIKNTSGPVGAIVYNIDLNVPCYCIGGTSWKHSSSATIL